MAWSIEYIKEAKNDLLKLDYSQRLQVLKAIEKVSCNPLSKYTTISKLAGYYKIKLIKLGIRVVYGLIREDKIMKIVVISVREDDAVYRLADKRV